jgi:hypothetical protein
MPPAFTSLFTNLVRQGNHYAAALIAHNGLIKIGIVPEKHIVISAVLIMSRTVNLISRVDRSRYLKILPEQLEYLVEM